MTYVVLMTDPKTGETTQSPRQFPSRDAAEAWASRMILHFAWKVELCGPPTPSARGLDYM